MNVIARNRKAIFPVICMICLCASSYAQSLLFPGDYLFEVKRQCKLALDTTTFIHTSLQPYVYKEIGQDTFKNMKPGDDRFFDKLLYEHLIELRHIDRSSGYPRTFNLDIDPIANFYYGKDVVDTTAEATRNNTRGFWVRGWLGKKLTFESAFIENQLVAPAYLYTYANSTGVIPGQGRWKRFKMAGFDFASSYGLLNYEVNKCFTIRMGHGKQKVGNGYRSLLLSDNSFNYPYLQVIGKFFENKLQYSQTYALLMNLSDGGTKTPPNTERIYQKKAATFQHLSWHTGKYLDLYFFHGTIWQGTDSGNVMHIDPLYINPLIFSNIAKTGFNNKDHALVGFGFEVRPFRQVAYYNQLVYDGSYNDYGTGVAVKKTNWGMQHGIKYYNAFGIKDLFLQVEYNTMQGQLYYNPKYFQQNYSHYNQTLTTPAWLPNELVSMLGYSYKRLFVQVKHNYFRDPSLDKEISYFDGKIGYLLNPRYNSNLSVGATVRSLLDGVPGSKAVQMQLFYVCLKTSLFNYYYDF